MILDHRINKIIIREMKLERNFNFYNNKLLESKFFDNL